MKKVLSLSSWRHAAARRRWGDLLGIIFFMIMPPVLSMEIDMPVETAVYRPSNLPGYQLVQQNCIVCHSAQYVTTQPPNSSRSYWTATVTKMQKTFGAPINEKDIPAMVDYLVWENKRQKAKSGKNGAQ